MKIAVQVSHTEGSKVVVAVASAYGITKNGVAKCSPDDKFDLNIGAKLASDRAKLKVFDAIYKEADTAADAFRKLAKESDKISRIALGKAIDIGEKLGREGHHE